MPIELEMKLAAQPEKINQIKQWLSQELGQTIEWQTSELVNTYYDTESHKLRELKIGLRVRRDGENYVQSVKSEGRVVGGLYQRNESETQIPNANLDLAVVEDPYLQILLEEAQEEDGALRALFRTDFERQAAMIQYQDSEIEVALDTGEISHRGHKSPICELELELKSGEAGAIFSLGQQLVDNFSLVLSAESKAERGYRLSSEHQVYLRRLDVVPLTAKSPAEGSFETIAHYGLAHWQHYIKLIKRELRIEYFLQLNRALLYMQHLYSVFAPLIPRHSLSEVRADWIEVTQNFSKVQQYALQLNWLENAKLYGFGYDALAEHENELRRKFELEGQNFIQYLSSPNYNLKLLHFSRWLYLKEWTIELKDSAKQRLQKEIFPFAIKQLQHQMVDVTRHLKIKEELQEKDYLSYLPKLYRTLDIGLFFGSLFDSKKRVSFRQNWVDLVANIELFKQLEYIRKVLMEHETRDPRLEETESEILQTLLELRTEAFTQNPYWN
ncbi:CYTH and CHAD domain-containing protein [Kangiella sp. TOML190]|uniref:CYTH and CHAD domain-containing protein n=1 Tax=Kangiella sp. TOML190 TaxID=2931351 RepID=UPI00203E1F07|nr:CYTH and CHAD domain-containing protein [Kangiella sp. TOML190]